ncbi:MAG: hypothetical protein RBU30_15285 [Polyangia bacterium]|nr:hypothetical protein [Polyangia bacterium]
MGDPPPTISARLLERSAPRRLVPGESAQTWALFDNLGSRVWLAGEVLLGSMAPRAGAPSLLWDPAHWPAHDVAAMLEEDAPPGGLVTATWSIKASMDLVQDASEAFVLLNPFGQPMRCPSPEVTITVGPAQRGPAVGDQDSAPQGQAATGEPRTRPERWVGGGCSVGGDGARTRIAMLMLAFHLE